MATFNKFNAFVENLAEKVHNLGSDTLKVYLSNELPLAADTVKADIAEITGGNGYTSGGQTLTITSSAQTGGLYKLVANDVTWTATGSVGPFRYVVLYNDTPTSPLDPLIGWYDYGSAVTLGNGETFTVDFSQTDGVLTIQ